MAGVGGIEGLVTGLDTVDLIDKMLEIERRPIYNLQDRIARNSKVMNAWETLEANLIALKIDAGNLYRRSRFLSVSALSSNEDILTASAGNLAVPGRYSLTVSQLAQSHQIASGTFSDKDETAVGTGTLTITTGTDAPVEIAVNSSNNTLEKVAKAINDSAAGVHATVINVGGDVPSYKLIVSGNETGSSQMMVIDENLSGGTGLQLGEIQDVTDISWSGTSSVGSSGNYTGNSDATFTFTVAAGGGGTVGSDVITLEYTDGGEISGNVTIPASYAAGDEIEIYGGMKLSLDAGTVVEGDSFSVSAVSSTIQAAVNASFMMGSGAGGANPVTIESSTNVITDLVEGVTLDLHSADPGSPLTIDIGVDSDKMVESVESFFNRYNDIISFFNNHFKYDPDLGEGGELFGDQYAIRLSMAVRSQITDMVKGLGQDLNNLAELGIRSSQTGNMMIDSATLRAAIENDPESVVRLFSTTGESSDADIEFLLASSNTIPSYLHDEEGYDIRITVAASRGTLTGTSMTGLSGSTPLVIDSTNNRLKIAVNGNESEEIVISEGSYTSGDALATVIQTAINADDSLGSTGVEVEYVDDGGGSGHFRILSTDYGSNSTVKLLEVSSSSIYSSIGVNQDELRRGTDVAGTINGEEALGSGKYLTGATGNEYTEGLQLLVSITPEQLAIQGEDQGKITVAKGVGARITEYINEITDLEDGALTVKKKTLEDMEKSMNDQIDILEASISKKEQKLFNDFVNLETKIGELQAEESFLTSMITQLQQQTNYKVKKNS